MISLTIFALAQYLDLHRKKTIEAQLQELKLALSDQNLELLPDYEQRVAVLKELQYIDETSTVLLKGRVACEVSRPSVSIRVTLLNNMIIATDQFSK